MRKPGIAVVPLLLGLPLILAAQQSQSQPNPLAQIDWQVGPAVATVGSQAQIKVPPGYRFAGAAGAKKFMELNENIPSGKEVGVLLPKDPKWFVVFEFDSVGYVKDDEKKSLDADAMLSNIKENTERGNEERRQRGWDTLTVLDWIKAPHYDEVTHNLEWAMRAQTGKGELVTNYNTRYLGRRGVMSVSVVTDPERLDGVLTGFRQVMSGFSYTPQNDYRAFVKGDKVAEYGLTALVVGGAAAVATKVGLFKGLWKLILVGWKFIVAGIAAIGAMLKRLFRREEKSPDAAAQQQS